MPEPSRCAWCGDDPLYCAYHDQEWGVPVHDDRTLFEMLVLDGAQAGLSWLTILRKRENYRRAFADFDIATVAAFTDEDQARLLQNPGIVRNRLKVASAVRNARASQRLQAEAGSLSAYFWDFFDGEPRQNAWRSLAEIPAETAESRRISKDLKQRGMNFVGPTIVYAFLQAAGFVNDHVVDCFRHRQLGGQG